MVWGNVYRFHDRLSVASIYAAALLVAAIAILYCVDVFARYLFNAPLIGVSAISGYLLTASIFLSIPQITREGRHVAILFVQEHLGASARSAYVRTISIVNGLACLIIAYVCASEVWRQFSEGLMTNSEIVLPQWWFSVFMPYAFVSAGLHFMRPETTMDALNV